MQPRLFELLLLLFSMPLSLFDGLCISWFVSPYYVFCCAMLLGSILLYRAPRSTW